MPLVAVCAKERLELPKAGGPIRPNLSAGGTDDFIWQTGFTSSAMTYADTKRSMTPHMDSLALDLTARKRNQPAAWDFPEALKL